MEGKQLAGQHIHPLIRKYRKQLEEEKKKKKNRTVGGDVEKSALLQAFPWGKI